MLSAYKAVFFDVGGTLLRVHPSVGDVYVQYARSYGFKGRAEEVEQEFRRQWALTGGIESLGGQSGEAAEKGFWKDLVFRVFQSFGGIDSFDSYFECIYEAFRQRDHWRVFEDVETSGIISRLKTRGVVLGIISNWDSRLNDILENTGLAGDFDFILASAVVGSAKPDGRIFAEALRQSGVQPHEACHIGDEPATDIRGAQDAGMDAILIDRKDRHTNGTCLKIKSFLELV